MGSQREGWWRGRRLGKKKVDRQMTREEEESTSGSDGKGWKREVNVKGRKRGEGGELN